MTGGQERNMKFPFDVPLWAIFIFKMPEYESLVTYGTKSEAIEFREFVSKWARFHALFSWLDTTSKWGCFSNKPSNWKGNIEYGEDIHFK